MEPNKLVFQVLLQWNQCSQWDHLYLDHFNG